MSMRVISKKNNVSSLSKNKSPILNDLVEVGDCLKLMSTLKRESIKAIYIDPPFFTQKIQIIDSKRKTGSLSYSDKWKSMDEYLSWLSDRISLMRNLLTADGFIFVHCDWHSSHRIKCILDDIFGVSNFRNEIIWQRSFTSGRSKGNTMLRFSNITDSIFVYSKSQNSTLNKSFVTLQKKFNGSKTPAGFKFCPKEKKYFKTSPLGNYSEESIAKFEKEGRIYLTKNGSKRLKYWVNSSDINGKMELAEIREIGNLWTDIPSMMHSGRNEKISYPTQKPMKLIERIFSLCVEKGDTVADFFLGSGTSWAVAQKLGCKFIGCDVKKDAVALAKTRVSSVQHVGTKRAS
ncbi:MAG: site-specific DNA-methyltransferase [Flavobacterium sp.]|nr:MAG: site-specific DNA-methyltransferase [Flavobacterium sp.]